MDDCITTSIFDIFKTGPGPSSSHTIGPMKAALMFRKAVSDMDIKQIPGDELGISVHLFGSLSLTGKGHGTHKAVLGGLMGWMPETCDCEKLIALLEEPEKTYEIPFRDFHVTFRSENICFEDGNTSGLPFANTMILRLVQGDKLLLDKEYYSVGGGFIQCKDEIETRPKSPPHAFTSMNSLRKLMRRTGFSLDRIILENEQAITGYSREKILKKIDQLVDAMCESVDRGLAQDGLLPGTIGLLRKARVLLENSTRLKEETARSLARLNAYAMAASEENAAGMKVVTAPTSGSAGVLPGIIYMLKSQYGLSREQLRQGMLAAAAIAFIAKKNASISGAEVGCQGEVGVASSMGAAFITYVQSGSMKKVENAAEIALEHQLGMTCDPVGGYVQIPCIERNAVGAVTAVNAYILAQAGDPARQKVTFDEVVETMMETGKDMCTRYKETALGGLALCCVSC